MNRQSVMEGYYLSELMKSIFFLFAGIALCLVAYYFWNDYGPLCIPGFFLVLFGILGIVVCTIELFKIHKCVVEDELSRIYKHIAQETAEYAKEADYFDLEPRLLELPELNLNGVTLYFSGTCGVCGGAFNGQKLIYCQSCRTPHHEDCWEYNGECSIYACRSKVATPS